MKSRQDDWDVCHSKRTHQKRNKIDDFGVAQIPAYYPCRPCTSNGNTIPQLPFIFEVVNWTTRDTDAINYVAIEIIAGLC